MVLNDDPSNTSPGDSSLLVGQRKWAIGVGVLVLVVALVGLWLRTGLDGTGVVPVLAMAIAVLGGAGLALWLVEE
jgi:hypothetical protein